MVNPSRSRDYVSKAQYPSPSHLSSGNGTEQGRFDNEGENGIIKGAVRVSYAERHKPKLGGSTKMYRCKPIPANELHRTF